MPLYGLSMQVHSKEFLNLKQVAQDSTNSHGLEDRLLSVSACSGDKNAIRDFIEHRDLENWRIASVIACVNNH